MGRFPSILVLATLVGVVAAEEAQLTAANVGISVMLLGSVGFMMGLFYLVNLKDKDMRKYSWQVISSTISIFSAVLLFQAVNGIVEHYVTEHTSEEFELLVSVVHMLMWFGLLQFVLAVISGAIGKPPEKGEDFEEMELMLKCWAVLLGHITGFAAINAFAILQQMVPKNVVATFLVSPFAWFCIFVLGLGTNQLREYVALADDGIKDEAEIKWDEETKETEDDIIGLAVSFVLAQTLRFAISGDLPDPEGNEPDEMLSNHSNREVLMLIGIAVFFTVLNVLRTIFIKKQYRFTPQMRNVVMMDFAWCCFFSSDWWLSTTFFASEHGMIKEVVLALFVTSIAFIMIFFLDKIADAFAQSSQNHKSDTDQAIRSIVQAFGILIGFSWEKAFDTAVQSCTAVISFMPPAWSKLVLAIGLAAVVIPAWRMHILPTIMEYEEDEEEEEEEGREEANKTKGNTDLDKPLLANEPIDQAGAKLQKQESNLNTEGRKSSRNCKELKGLNNVELKAKCLEYLEKIKELESRGAHSKNLEVRNMDLEASLNKISAQIHELENVTEVLSK